MPTISVFRHSQPIKAVASLSLVMILSLVISSALLLFDLHESALVHAKGEIISLGRILSEQTTRAFDGVALSMRGARERLSDDIGRKLELNSFPVRLLLQSRTPGLPQIKSMFLVGRDGMVVNSSRTDFQSPFSVANRDFFRHFADDSGDNELFISRPEPARLDGQWTYYISMRLLDESGKFRGVLAAAISIGYFESLYESIRLDFVSRIVLLNQDGLLMAGQHGDQPILGKSYLDGGSLAEVMAKDQGELVKTRVDAQGDRWLVGYRLVSKYPLIVSLSGTEEEALMPWRRIALPITVGVAVVIIFILMATVFVIMNLLGKERLEVALKESDAKLRHMVRSVRDAILTVDSSGRLILFNVAAERMFGVQASEALGNHIDEVLSRSQPKPLALNFMRHLNEGRQSPSGLEHLSIISFVHGGREFPVELSLSATTFRGDALVTAVFRDLSERQRAEHELIETNRQLHELAAAQQNVREEERLRISRELHDELGQSLTGIKMEVSWLGNRLLATQPEMENKVSSLKKLIDGSISAVRRISSELRPLVLDDLGFSAAANWYVTQFSERTGINITLSLPAHDPENGSTIATTLFRILQESLTNIARHAGAKNVDVQLGFSENYWQLSVKDDGAGFNEKQGGRKGIGLIGMKERVRILGGAFNLTTAPGKGVLIEVRVPAALVG
ncbi:MAG: PAS domain S-box protein [Azonexaceae bacterium]|nr:PAS domain S-box protein [Azonexaceae bacterium]